jgi:ectoine hydroxylase-related dioxygenase (phytanoyl-CoA dioxygenase family)
MHITEQKRKQYAEDGFFLEKQLFSPQQLKQLREWLRSLAANRDAYPESMFVVEEGGEQTDDPLAQIRKIQQLHAQEESLSFFGPQSQPASIASEMIGTSELRYGSSCFTKPPFHGSQTPWHQDQLLWSIWTPTALSCWIAIDRCTIQNGCLQFVKGSHLEGIEKHVSTEEIKHPHIPAERVPAERVVHMEMEPGDAVFFGGMAWHFSEPNRSEDRRLGIVAVYNSEREYKETDQIAAWVNSRTDLGMGIGGQKKRFIQLSEERG